MKQSVALAVFVALSSSAPLLAQKPAEKSKLVAEKGKLQILVDGQNAGTEDFSISSAGTGWMTHGEVRIQVPGANASKLTSTLRLNAQGNPTQYEWQLQSEKKIGGTVVFEGGNANVELRQEGAAPYTQQHMFGDQSVVILDNNFYHHYAILGRLYDWEKKGAQTFSVYVPQDMVPGTVTLDSAGQQEADGAKFDLLRLRTSDLEVFLYFDKQKLMRITVPGSKVMVVRE